MAMPRTYWVTPQQEGERKAELKATASAPGSAAVCARPSRRNANQAPIPRRHKLTGAMNLLLPRGPSTQSSSVVIVSPNEPALNPKLLRSAHRPVNPAGSCIHSAFRNPSGRSLEKSTCPGTKLRQNNSASRPESTAKATSAPRLFAAGGSLAFDRVAAAALPPIVEAMVSTLVLTSLTC